MDSSHYVRVPTPVIGNDAVNKTYSDSQNPTSNLNMFTISISNNGNIISFTSTTYPAGTYTLPNALSFSTTL